MKESGIINNEEFGKLVDKICSEYEKSLRLR